MPIRPFVALLALLGALLPPPARAYGPFADPFALGSLQFQYTLNRIQLQSIERNAERLARSRAAPLPTAERPRATAARELAEIYPAAERERVAKVFETLLTQYREIEDRFGVARGDLGGAMAAFVAGNWMAMRQQPFPDAHYAALVRQMRELIAADPAYQRLEAQERRRGYEQLAIVGMFMAATQMALAQQPDPRQRERSVAAARRNLAAVLPVDPESVQLTATGLSLR